MENGTFDPALLATCLYKLESIRRIDPHEPIFRQQKPLHGMLLLQEAAGSVIVNDNRYSLERHQAFLLSSGSEARLDVRLDGRTTGYYLQFYVLQATGSGHYAAAAELPCPVEVPIVPGQATLLFDKAKETEKKHGSSADWDRMEANVRFQEIVSVLFREMADRRRPGLNAAMERAKAYIEGNYRANVTREVLADIAGLNADYFSRAFKRKYKLGPTAYLNDIRIRRAQRLLIETGEPVRSVAESVGFSDEFYFSRKFKSATGHSPAAYVKRIKHAGKVASLNHLITGHLMALGLEPYAAIINDAYPVVSNLGGTIAVGRLEPDLDKLLEARPDLIVGRGSRYAGNSPREQLLHQIAPTITLPYADSWRSHLQTIAGIVGRDKEADDWLAQYESKSERLRKQIKSRTGDEAFLVVGIGEDGMCVYGRRNIGTVLYDDLQLCAPEGIREIRHYRAVSLDELPSFEADRIVLTVFRQDGVLPREQAVRRQLRTLNASRQWQSLKAVRSGKVYGIYDSQHLYTSYNPLSHSLFLDKIRRMLLEGG